MTIQWQYLAVPGAGVLSLSGYLGSEATDRFAGAIGWVVARGTGPIIIDPDLRAALSAHAAATSSVDATP